MQRIRPTNAHRRELHPELEKLLRRAEKAEAKRILAALERLPEPFRPDLSTSR
jgi:hypothetical protein